MCGLKLTICMSRQENDVHQFYGGSIIVADDSKFGVQENHNYYASNLENVDML